MMPPAVFFATGNPGKLTEVNAIFAAEGFNVNPLPEAEPPFTAIENGLTFAENAAAKATQALGWLREKNIASAAVLADDSGLCVDALHGEPGVFSARYLGEDTSYVIKNNHIIQLLNGLPDEKRAARYECVIACAFPDGHVLTANGTMNGIIATEPRGNGGFGYDPVFYLPEYGKTAAELPPQVKNAISHRGMALRAMLKLFTAEALTQ